MNAKHTPGPWILAEVVKNKFTTTDMRRVRSANEGFEHGAVCEVYGARDGSVSAANAALISAAPELLQALLEGCRVLETNMTAIVDTVWVSNGAPETLLDHFRAAIAKATGGQQ